MSRYKSLNHSKFRIRYHLIFSTKYRRDCLVGIEQSVEQVFREIGDVSDFDVVEVSADKDHVHIVVSSKPTVAPVDIVRHLKQISVHRLWKLHYDHLAQFFWGKRRGSSVWTGGYFCETIGRVQEGTILNYVKNQGRGP